MNQKIVTHNLIRGCHLLVIATLLAGLALSAPLAPVARARR